MKLYISFLLTDFSVQRNASKANRIINMVRFQSGNGTEIKCFITALTVNHISMKSYLFFVYMIGLLILFSLLIFLKKKYLRIESQKA